MTVNELFENWYMANHFNQAHADDMVNWWSCGKHLTRSVYGEYMSHHAQLCWEGFQGAHNCVRELLGM